MILGTTFDIESVGQRLTLENTVSSDLRATCVVNGTELLNAIISTTGKVSLSSRPSTFIVLRAPGTEAKVK